jgi:hypothetical protein
MLRLTAPHGRRRKRKGNGDAGRQRLHPADLHERKRPELYKTRKPEQCDVKKQRPLQLPLTTILCAFGSGGVPSSRTQIPHAHTWRRAAAPPILVPAQSGATALARTLRHLSGRAIAE